MLLNGPINVARLEGKMGNTVKILYAFMDWHADISNQTKCESIDAIDITTYMTDTLQKTNKKQTFDFFLEVYPTFLMSGDSLVFAQKYIWSLQEIHRAIIQKRTKNNKLYENIRFHYIDIRDFMRGIKSDDDSIIQQIQSENIYSINSIDETIELLKNSITNIDIVIDSLSTADHKGGNIKYPVSNNKDRDMNTKIWSNFVSKIKFKQKYHDDNVYKVIGGLLKSLAQKCNDLKKGRSHIINELENYINELDKTPHFKLNKEAFIEKEIYHYYPDDYKFSVRMAKIKEQIEMSINAFMSVVATIVDLYFLRRFLDKDYITNGIIYTGIYHSCNYIKILCKYFDFKITHISKLNGTLAELYDKINSSADVINDRQIDVMIYPEYPYQCSNIQLFPANFA